MSVVGVADEEGVAVVIGDAARARDFVRSWQRDASAKRARYNIGLALVGLRQSAAIDAKYGRRDEDLLAALAVLEEAWSAA